MSETYNVPVSDGVEIVCKVHGNPSSENVFLCPGLGATQLSFASDANFFVSQGFRTITVDLRGHGASTLPDSLRTSKFTLMKLADDLDKVMQSLDLTKVHYVGNSLGGVIGLELIKQGSERIQSLCTFGTTYQLELPKIQAYVQYLVARLMGKEKLSSAISKSTSDINSARRIIKSMYKTYNAKVAKCIALNICKYDYLRTIQDWEGSILLLKGDKDHSINKYLSSTLNVLRERAGSDIREISAAGHFTNLDNPKDVRQHILHFIKGLQ